MAEFYVEKKANEAGVFLVHDAVCPSLPARDTMYYIGPRSNKEAPMKEAANQQFSPTMACPQCMAG